MYNAVLTGMSLDGKAFTYVNQLASSDQDLSERYEWFECACCPPNVTRTLGFLGGYFWSHITGEQSAVVNVHMYTSTALRFKVSKSTVTVTQKTDWPWNGDVEFETHTDGPPVDLELRLRIPGWATSWEVSRSPDWSFVRESNQHQIRLPRRQIICRLRKATCF